MANWPLINQNTKSIFALHMPVGAFATDWHTHPHHQLLTAESGVLHFQSEEKHLILPARHGAWIPGHRPHRIYSNSPNLYLRSIYFRGRESDEAILRQFHIFPLPKLAREMILYSEIWPVDGEASHVEEQFYETLKLLLVDWCQQPIPLVLPTSDHPQVVKIISFMEGRLSEALPLAYVAKEHGIAGRTLMRLFNDQLGMTFGAYLRAARVARALELLTEPAATVTEVAYEVGYTSLSSFSQTFRRLIGLQPRQYRALQAGR
jgi:AraC-like DNA-binding protein